MILKNRNISINTKIEKLELSNRATNRLKKHGIETIGELILLSEEEVRALPYAGVKTIDEIMSAIREINTFLSRQDNKNIITEIEEDRNPDGFLERQISDTDLSVRSKNVLFRNGIFTLKEMDALSEEDLRSMRGIGTKSINEILEMVKKNRESAREKGKEKVEVWERACEMAKMFSDTGNSVYIDRLFDIRNEFYIWLTSIPKQDEVVLSEAVRSPFFDDLFRSALLNASKDGYVVDDDSISGVFPEKLSSLRNNYIDCWLEDDFLDIEGDHYILHYQTALEYVEGIEDERTRKIVLMRLNGFVLEQIGNKYNVTRERVRQITNKCLVKFPKVMEDRYSDVFEKYCIEKDAFVAITGFRGESYEYLKLRHEKGDNDLKGLLEENLPEYMLVNAEKYIYRDYIDDDGIKVEKKKSSIALHLLKKYEHAVSGEILTQKYREFVEYHGLANIPNLEITDRYVTTTFVKYPGVLLVNGRRVCYARVTPEDMPDLLFKIGFYEIKDMEISTRYFTDRYPEVMEEYSIHDEYELHNLLKKNVNDESIVFGRQPTIIFGKGDRFEQVWDLLVEEAPISQTDLAIEYQERYGSDVGSVMANFFINIEQYLSNGIYRIDYEDLTIEERRILSKMVDEDYMPIKDIKEAYAKELPGHDLHKLNSYNFRLLGYKISENLVFKADKYSSVSSILDDYLAQGEFDLSDKQWLLENRIIYYRIRDMKLSWDIFEIADGRFITDRLLNAIGITKSMLEDYSKKVRDFAGGQMFTVQYLEKSGFNNPYAGFGMSTMFWDSVLYGSGFFGRQKLGRQSVYKEGTAKLFNSCLLIREIVEKYGSISPNDIRNLLEYDYGITLEKNKIYHLVSEADLFYSSAKKKIYISYERFFDEL